MPSLKHILTCCFIWVFPIIVFSQRPDKHADAWLFGEKAGISFKSGVAQNIATNAMDTKRATATYADENGDLLLYSNGQKVWNKNGQVIQGADNLIDDDDPFYSGLIVPIPENPDQFYVFSIEKSSSSITELPIYYTKIDLSLNGGNGGVAESRMALWSGTSFGITSVKHCNNKDYWIIIHKGLGNQFLTFSITKDGITNASNPITSVVGTSFSGSSNTLAQEIIASQDGSKVLISRPGGPQFGFFELFGFDNSTGEITESLRTVPGLGQIGGIAFSPDAKYFYISRLRESKLSGSDLLNKYSLLQFSTSSNASDQIFEQTYVGTPDPSNSGSYIFEPGRFGKLRLGPDGKIYLAHRDANFLSVIHKPDELLDASNFEYQGLTLDQKSSSDLPNTVAADYPEAKATLIFQEDSLECNPSLYVKLEGVSETRSTFQWLQDGIEIPDATKKIYLTTGPGEYEVRVKDACDAEIFSNKKQLISGANLSPPDTEPLQQYCQGESIQPLSVFGNEIKWYRDSSGTDLLQEGGILIPKIDSNATGTYSFFVTQMDGSCESPPAEMQIIVLDASPLNLGDSILKECLNNRQIGLNLLSDTSEEIEWLFEGNVISNEANITVNQYGSYIVQKVEAFCPSADTVLIEDGCIKFYFPNAFTPNGDGDNDTFMLFGTGSFQFDFEIKDRRGTVMYIVKEQTFNDEPILLWDGNYGGKSAPVGVYSFYFQARVKEEGTFISQSRDGSISLLR